MTNLILGAALLNKVENEVAGRDSVNVFGEQFNEFDNKEADGEKGRTLSLAQNDMGKQNKARRNTNQRAMGKST